MAIRQLIIWNTFLLISQNFSFILISFSSLCLTYVLMVRAASIPNPLPDLQGKYIKLSYPIDRLIAVCTISSVRHYVTSGRIRTTWGAGAFFASSSTYFIAQHQWGKLLRATIQNVRGQEKILQKMWQPLPPDSQNTTSTKSTVIVAQTPALSG